MDKTFPENIKRLICDAQHGYCKNCLNPAHSPHHKLPNTVSNRAKFPLFINSPMNLVYLCERCHKNKAHLFRIKPELAQVYETWLRAFMVSMPFTTTE